MKRIQTMCELIGGVYGRFQPLHIDHKRYILNSFQNCDYLVICITCPDPGSRYSPQTEPMRGSSESNPFTFYERLQMTKKMLNKEDISTESYDIVPISFSELDYISHYVPDRTTFYTTIYGEWDEKKRYLLESVGFQVKKIKSLQNSKKRTTGTDVRKKMRNMEEWSHLVPDPVYQYISRNSLANRLR